MYATGGKDFCMLAIVVDIANNVVTPNVTRAGAYKSILKQKVAIERTAL